MLFESLFHGAAKNLSAMALQEVVQPIDVVEPLPGPAVNDLGEVEESRLSEFQQLLALQITLAALARYRRHQGRAMRGERRAFVGNEFPRMVDFDLPATMRTRSAYKYSVAGMEMASGGIE